MPAYTEADLAQLIKGLESEFTKEFSKAGVLSKSEDGEKEKKPSDEKKDGDKAPPAEAKPAEEKPAAEAKPAEGQPPAAAPAPAAESHGYDNEDMEHMRQMYASMSKAELIAHHDCIKQALDAQSGAQPGAQPSAQPAPGADKNAPPMGMGKSEKPHMSEVSNENPTLNSKPKENSKAMNGDASNGGIEGQNPSGPVGARSEASKDSKNLKDAMNKAERQTRNGGKIEETGDPKGSPGAKSPASTDQGNLSDMEKSEKDLMKSQLDAKDAQIADLKKNMDAVQAFLTKFVEKTTAPKGKAITEIGTLAKGEDGSVGGGDLSKAEITAKLLAKSADPRTSAQDRAAINAFYLNGANVNTISHLLK